MCQGRLASVIQRQMTALVCRVTKTQFVTSCAVMGRPLLFFALTYDLRLILTINLLKALRRNGSNRRTEAAQNDLNHIIVYILKSSLQHSNTYFESIYESIECLKQFKIIFALNL